MQIPSSDLRKRQVNYLMWHPRGEIRVAEEGISLVQEPGLIAQNSLHNHWQATEHSRLPTRRPTS